MMHLRIFTLIDSEIHPVGDQDTHSFEFFVPVDERGRWFNEYAITLMKYPDRSQSTFWANIHQIKDEALFVFQTDKDVVVFKKKSNNKYRYQGVSYVEFEPICKHMLDDLFEKDQRIVVDPSVSML